MGAAPRRLRPNRAGMSLLPRAACAVAVSLTRAARPCQTLYFFSGDRCTIGGTELTNHAAVKVRTDAAVQIVADGGGAVELLLLQVR